MALPNGSPVSQDEAAREHLLMNLRLAEGLDLAAYEQRWGAGPDAAKIAALSEHGFVALDDGWLCATPQGRLLLNRVIEDVSGRIISIFSVMAGLDPAIHVPASRWMAGSEAGHDMAGRMERLTNSSPRMSSAPG